VLIATAHDNGSEALVARSSCSVAQHHLYIGELLMEISAGWRAIVIAVALLALTAGLTLTAQTGPTTLRPMPYVTIDHPQFVAAPQATFLNPRDRVIGISSGEVAKAYPAAILAQHGVVQDSTPAGPIAVTW
jgi:hypothetical protein